MSDIFSKRKRTEIMRNIKSKNTGLEISTKKILRHAKIKFRSYPKLYGNPDFLLENKALLFCDSSFWHGRGWANLKKRLLNGNNPAYWTSHIEKNRNRDKLVTKTLRKEGYKVIRFWDKDIYKRPDWCITKIKKSLN